MSKCKCRNCGQEVDTTEVTLLMGYGAGGFEGRVCDDCVAKGGLFVVDSQAAMVNAKGAQLRAQKQPVNLTKDQKVKVLRDSGYDAPDDITEDQIDNKYFFLDI